MKGTILVCLRDMLFERCAVSQDDWKNMLEAAGLDRHLVLLPSADLPDAAALALFGEAQARYFSSHEALADAFGSHWCVRYAPDVYPSIYRRVSNAREFIMKMDDVHVQITQTIENARPPRFQYEDLGRGGLLVRYQSARGLIQIFAGLCRGIGEYYGEALEVKVLDTERVSITFLAA